MLTRTKKTGAIAGESDSASVSEPAQNAKLSAVKKLGTFRSENTSAAKNQTAVGGLDSYSDYAESKKEYEKAKASMPKNYSGGDYTSRLNELADKIFGRKEFSYDYSTDDSYLAYLKSYRDSGLEAAENALSSMSKMSAGYGNSYAYKSSQSAYERYMSKAADKIPELTAEAYSRYLDEEDTLYNKYNLLSDEESKNYSRYRDSAEDAKYRISTAYRDMTDASDRYYKDRDYNHTLERESIDDKRYETEYADKLKQQETENDLNERKFLESVMRGDFEDSLAERKYQSDLEQKKIENDLNEKKYQSDLEQKKIENDLNERKFNDQVAEEIAESYRYERDNLMKERQWGLENELSKAKLEEEKKQNAAENEYKNKALAYSKENDERNYELSKQKAESEQDMQLKEYNEKIREFDENMIYKKYFS